MKTVHEVSRITGVSIRTLHYYDSIGLLSPADITEAGYRLYDDNSLLRLQNIMLLRELQFSLKDIASILDNPNFDRKIALKQQIELLEMQKEHITNLIAFAKGIQTRGDSLMDFSAFDTSKIENYAAEAKAMWGKTDAYKEYEHKSNNRTENEQKDIVDGLMRIFSGFGKIKTDNPDSKASQKIVKELQDYISEHFYTCSNEILAGLGKMYCQDERMTKNIDAVGGEGTADFAAKAIEFYCK